MADFTIKNDLMYDTKTGTAYRAVDTNNEHKKFYAVVVMCGHCGNGYFIPFMLNISAASEQDAVNSAMKAGRVKKNAKNKILACREINGVEFRAIEHINDCDPYNYAEDNTTEIADLYERRIAMEGVKDWQDLGEHKKWKRKASIEEVRTADMYEDKYVLQRYFAPHNYGGKLVYPKKVNFRDMLDEFLYYNTLEIGIKRGKIHALSYYYQLYGEDNNLGIRYDDGYLTYTNQYNEEVSVCVDKFMREHLDLAKEKFMNEQKPQEEQIIKDIKLETPREKYLRRLKKYLKIKNNENQDDSQRQ